MGLLTGDAKGEVAERIPEKMVSVFVPTTPNPTSGWLIFVPVESVQELDMDVDDAFKMIISGGVLHPESNLPKVRSQLTKCDTRAYMQGFQAFLLIAGLWGKRASVVLGAASLVYFIFCKGWLSICRQPHRRYLVFAGDAGKTRLSGRRAFTRW